MKGPTNAAPKVMLRQYGILVSFNKSWKPIECLDSLLLENRSTNQNTASDTEKIAKFVKMNKAKFSLSLNKIASIII